MGIEPSARKVSDNKRLSHEAEILVRNYISEIVFAFNQDSTIAVQSYRDILLSFHEKMKELEK